MVRPQVVDEGNGLQIWRVAANIPNKQSQAADKGWSSGWGLWHGANNSLQKIRLLQNVIKGLRPGRILWFMTYAKENGREFWYVGCKTSV
jgi:hypothetical protein